MNTEDRMPFAFEKSPKDKSKNIIKVIGVGGGGSNAVKNMYKQGVHDVSFAICNTDSQALARAEIPVKIQLGEEGLGVGGKPEKGKAAAELNLDEIRSLFEDETEMVFITCGMGGGTGTGAGPVIAGVAKEKGILTVGVVTIPFAFEGKVRIEKALKGVEEMRKNVDSLLVINNERLCELYADGITTVEQAFAKADEIVTVAAKSISEIITMEGIVNRDFCDVQTVMENGGKAIMSVGRANGENRIGKAFVDALKSPLLNNVEIEKARRLLYIIYSSDEHQVTISELKEINLFMDDLAQDIEVLWGVYRDNSLDEDVRVALIATDFSEDLLEKQNEKTVDDKNLMNSFQMYYGNTKNEEKESINENTETKEELVAKYEEEKISIPKSSNKTFLERFMKKLENILDMTE